MTIQINGYEFPVQTNLTFFERSALRNAIGLKKWQELTEKKRLRLTPDYFDEREFCAFKDGETVYIDYAEIQQTRQVATIHAQK